MTKLVHIVLTPGEPAGIGPDLAVILSQQDLAARLTVVSDTDLILARAKELGIDCKIRQPSSKALSAKAHKKGGLDIEPMSLACSAQSGQLDSANANVVLQMLDRAADGCLSGEYDAMVTGPVHKGVINDAGISFSGHTEYLAARTNAYPVMLLANKQLRVALVTTHLPLKDVAAHITKERVQKAVQILHQDLINKFAIAEPRILVCGLNPHAGEGGHFGREEIEIIEPALSELRAQGLRLKGPVPADTAFVQSELEQADVVLAMYHDQGLPVIKHAGFGEVVNVTLGLPFIRTSVDHGTAIDKAGSGDIDSGSMLAAIEMAIEMASSHSH